MNMSIFFKLFDAQVKPMLLYSSELWGMTRYKAIESVHLFACKRLVNVSARTPNTMAFGEVRKYPIYREFRYYFALLVQATENASEQIAKTSL